METKSINNTSYVYSAQSYFKTLLDSVKSNKDNKLIKALHSYQYLTTQYFIENDFLRGILIYYDMGMGKTRQAMSIAEHYIKSRPVYILASKTLHNSFINDTIKLLRALDDTRTDEEIMDYINEKYTFITVNASNMSKQFNKALKRKSNKEDVVLADITAEDILFEDRLESLSSKDLSGALVIIDEVHNLCNSITNGSKNATLLYNTIMDTKDIKLVFLSGTPIINNPFELVPLFNMLHGYIETPTNDTRNPLKKHTLFPEYYADFNNYFIDNMSIKNKDKFMDRLTGLILYYGTYKIKKNLLTDMSIIYAPKNTPTQDNKYNQIIISTDGFPDKRKTIIKRIPMSMEQFKAYSATRKLEKAEESQSSSRAYTEHTALNKNVNKSTSTYRVKSRLMSNFLLPENKKIQSEYIKNLNTYSPKYAELLYNITEGVLEAKNSIHVIYSNFVSNNGLYAIERILQANGTDLIDAHSLDNLTPSKNPKYAKITGDIPPDDRIKIIDAVNSQQNYEGKVIKYLLISPTGVEGVNILTARHFHYIEPHWNFKTFEQAEARIYRYGALKHLPKKDRWVQSHLYLSSYPENIPDDIKTSEPTTDEELLFRSIKNKNLSNQFLQALIEASINCTTFLHPSDNEDIYKINCRKCIPDNKKLYHGNIQNDINIPSPCKTTSTEEIEVNEIVMGDNTYYYTKNSTIKNIKVYIHNKQLDIYTPLNSDSPEFKKIILHLF